MPEPHAATRGQPCREELTPQITALCRQDRVQATAHSTRPAGVSFWVNLGCFELNCALAGSEVPEGVPAWRSPSGGCHTVPPEVTPGCSGMSRGFGKAPGAPGTGAVQWLRGPMLPGPALGGPSPSHPAHG